LFATIENPNDNKTDDNTKEIMKYTASIVENKEGLFSCDVCCHMYVKIK